VNATADALLAIAAAADGDAEAAEAYLSRARRRARTAARRDRQIVEIASLVVSGRSERAAGLAAVHSAEFPDDTLRLQSVVAAGGHR
jgi:hypothetical protein